MNKEYLEEYLYKLKMELNDNKLYKMNMKVNVYSRQEQFKFYEFVAYGTDETMNISFSVEAQKLGEYKNYRDTTYLSIDAEKDMLVCKALKKEAIRINTNLIDVDAASKLIVEYIETVLYRYPYTNHQC